MRKWYKKISWLVNGIIIGLIIAGLIDQSVTAMVIGAVLGLVAVVLFKGLSWLQQRRSGW
jgi:hypothetical protein